SRFACRRTPQLRTKTIQWQWRDALHIRSVCHVFEFGFRVCFEIRVSSFGFPSTWGCFRPKPVLYYGAGSSWPECQHQQRELYIMQTTIEETPVHQKTRELCQAILDQPNMQSIRQRIDAFMGDQKARAQYDTLVTKGQALQEKEQMSVPLSREEITDF